MSPFEPPNPDMVVTRQLAQALWCTFQSRFSNKTRYGRHLRRNLIRVLGKNQISSPRLATLVDRSTKRPMGVLFTWEWADLEGSNLAPWPEGGHQWGQPDFLPGRLLARRWSRHHGQLGRRVEGLLMRPEVAHPELPLPLLLRPDFPTPERLSGELPEGDWHLLEGVLILRPTRKRWPNPHEGEPHWAKAMFCADLMETADPRNLDLMLEALTSSRASLPDLLSLTKRMGFPELPDEDVFRPRLAHDLKLKDHRGSLAADFNEEVVKVLRGRGWEVRPRATFATPAGEVSLFPSEGRLWRRNPDGIKTNRHFPQDQGGWLGGPDHEALVCRAADWMQDQLQSLNLTPADLSPVPERRP